MRLDSTQVEHAGSETNRVPKPSDLTEWNARFEHRLTQLASCRESQLLSYIDVYFLLAIIAALMAPLAMMLRPIEREPR
jgi:hypothetical protein